MHLNFIAKHRPGESLSCLLIRQAEGVFLSPGELLSRLGSKCNPSTELLALLRANKCSLAAIWPLSDLKQSATYQQVAESRQYKQWINYNTLGVCYRCAEAGFVPESHDFSIMPACTKHSLKLSKECSACSRPYSVNRYHLTHCRCGEPIRSIKASEAEIEEAHYVEKLLHGGDFDSLNAYKELRSITRRFAANNIELSPYIDYINGQPEPLAEHISIAAQQLTHISLRALSAPFACAASEIVKLYAPRLLSSLHRPKNGVKGVSTPIDFRLDQTEFRYTLGLKPQTAAAIESRFFNLTSRVGRPSASFTYQTLARFFEPLLPETDKTTCHSVSLADLSASQKLTIDALIERVLTGGITLHSYDDTRPLSQIRVVNDMKSNNDAPKGYMTLSSVVAQLDSYEEAVRGARDAGLLPATHQRSCNNRYLFAENDVEDFHKKYALIGELARETQYQPMRLSDRLRELGVIPVAGPFEGNSPVSIFRRSDINDADLKGALKITNYATNSGRKPKSTSRFDSETWATGQEVAAELDIPLAQLHRITRHDLLVKGVPRVRGSQRRYYYRRDSVETTKDFLNKAVDINDLSKQLNTNRKKLISRYLYLLKAEPIKVGSKSLVPEKDANTLLSHYRNYLDAQAAATYLSTTRHQIGNWKKASRITPIPPDDDNYIRSPQLFRLSDITRLKQTLIEESKAPAGPSVANV